MNPLAALWFAVEQPAQSKEKNAVVWCLQPTDDDFVSNVNEESPMAAGRTKLFKPNQISARIRAQNGFFSVHRRGNTDKFIPLQKNRIMKQKMRKIEIEPSAFSSIRFFLDRFGVNRSSLFPDLDGLCTHLTWSFSKMPDD